MADEQKEVNDQYLFTPTMTSPLLSSKATLTLLPQMNCLASKSPNPPAGLLVPFLLYPCRIRFAPQAGSFFPTGFFNAPSPGALTFQLFILQPSGSLKHSISATHVFYSFIFYITRFLQLHKPSHRVRPHARWPPSCKADLIRPCVLAVRLLVSRKSRDSKKKKKKKKNTTPAKNRHVITAIAVASCSTKSMTLRQTVIDYCDVVQGELYLL